VIWTEQGSVLTE